MESFQVQVYKWKSFERSLRDKFYEKQEGLVGKVDIVLTKHFTHRVMERSYPLQYTTIRRTLYHLLNTRLCEILFWCYSSTPQKVFVQRKDLCIILDRGDTQIIIRTFWRNENTPDTDKYFYIKL